MIVFVALLSVGFLQRKIQCREWIGIVIVITGLIIVGISDFMFNKDINVDTNSVITGGEIDFFVKIVCLVPFKSNINNYFYFQVIY